MTDSTQVDYESSSKEDRKQRQAASKGGQASYTVWYEFGSDDTDKGEEEEDQK